MVEPLQVLLASVPVALESTTVTEEEDQLLGDVTTTDVAARPSPDQVQDSLGDATPGEKDDVKLTSEDVGDNMEDI